MTDAKHFDEWLTIKKKLQRNKKVFVFHEREIWWFAAGENIGSEINGKGERFSRPVLVIRKYGKEGFFGVPLSSQMHKGIWYECLSFGGINQTALLSQASTYSVHRLYDKMGRVSNDDFLRIKNAIKQLIFKEK